MPLFSASGYVEQLDPPGYVFIMGPIPEHQVYTFLNWIAENDWDYEAKGPAKIGGASWRDGYSDTIITEMKRYCDLYPDQFEWVGGYLKDFTFTWGPEVEALKDRINLTPYGSSEDDSVSVRTEGNTAGDE